MCVCGVCKCVHVLKDVNCFMGVGNYDYIVVFVRNKAFPRCGKTFFVNISCEFDEHAYKKNFSSEQCVIDSKKS